MEKPIKVIIVDDKVSWRKLIRTMLLNYKIKTIGEAGNGEELIKILEDIEPDVILLDLSMPIMNGSQTMDWINANYPELKVIILSFYDDNLLVDDYFKRGAKGFISKEDAAASIAELARAITMVYNGGRYLNLERVEKLNSFTPRQKEILVLISEGNSSLKIAEVLGVTPRAVEKQRKKIMSIISVKTFSEFYTYLYRQGLFLLKGPRQKNK